MILNNITQAQQFLPSLNLTLENNRFHDFFLRAQEWLVSHIIGEDIEDVLEMDMNVGQEDIHSELRLKCQRVIAEKALLDAIPEMDMQLTEAGFAVQNNQDFSPASSQRVDRLLAKMPERIAQDIDAIVRFLMKTSTGNGAYGYWRSSDQFNYLTAAFVPCFEEYNKIASPKANTYEAYYAALDTVAREMVKVADYYVSKAEIERLVELYRDGEALQVHRVAIAELKVVGIAAFCGDIAHARNAAVNARETMLGNPDSFPEFKASSAFNSSNINLDGGKMVNFL